MEVATLHIHDWAGMDLRGCTSSSVYLLNLLSITLLPYPVTRSLVLRCLAMSALLQRLQSYRTLRYHYVNVPYLTVGPRG